jgi:heme/copper-type cytochrome/quinol oxidase subunit 2
MTAPNELPDTAEAMEAKETAHKLPVGFLLLFFGLIAWGLYYLFAYSPWSTGWTQAGELEQAQATSVNITHTVAYTAIPALVLLVLAVAMARKRPGKK